MGRVARADASETDAELVAALFSGAVPLAIMTATFALVGLCVVGTTGDTGAAAILLVGLVAAAVKFRLIASFRHRQGAGPSRSMDAWEDRFAAANAAYAAAIGVMAARTFILPPADLQLLGTGMLFGFCSGQVVRLSTRPRLAVLSIIVATVPCVAAAAAWGDVAHVGLAAIFLVFTFGSIECVAFLYRHTRARIAANRELVGMAARDPLTGVLNRLGLRRAVEERFAAAATGGALLGVHWFDLDGFKGVNDRHGHSVGDALLVGVAGRVRDVLREGDVVARVGGDEFVVLQADLAHGDEAELFARRLLRTITAPFPLAGHQVTIGTSIGSCTGRPGIDPIDDLLGAADQRMYEAKRAGGGILSRQPGKPDAADRR